MAPSKRQIFDPVNGVPVGSVGIHREKTGDEIRLTFVDVASGEVLEQVSVRDSDEWLADRLQRSLPVIEEVMWISHGDGEFRALLAPWAGDDVTPIMVTAVDGHFLAIVDSAEGPRVWTSADAANWTNNPPPGFFDEALTLGFIDAHQGVVANVVSAAIQGIDLSTWVSTDGLSWIQAREAMPTGDIFPSSFGWVLVHEEITDRGRWIDLTRTVRLSPDGEKWQKVEVPWGANFAELNPSVAYNTIFLIVDDGYRRILWVGSVD